MKFKLFNMKIRPLAKADYNEWRSLWVSYLEFYETSLKADVIDETFSRFIDNDQTRQNALVAEITGELVGLVHMFFILTLGQFRKFAIYKICLSSSKSRQKNRPTIDRGRI